MKIVKLKKEGILKNDNKGITLITLITTIIILLILAGISITVLTGDNGLINKAAEAKNATESANEKEELEVAVTRLYDKRGNLDATKVVDGINKDIKNLNIVTATEGNFPVKVEYKNGHKYQITKDGDIMISVNAGDTAPDDANAAYSSGDYTAIIPAGYTVSGTEVETSIENGLVVRDSKQNEWVWIPVSTVEVETMYAKDSTGWKMGGTEVVTNYKTTGTYTRVNPGATTQYVYREPDVLNNESYDGNPTNLAAAGFKNLTDMATNLRDDYKNMIESIKQNGGFYVGRYELGKNTSDNNKPQVKKGTVMTMEGINWYNLYSACKSFSNGNVEARMIWGCQWDQICKFISTAKDANGDLIDLNDSRKYGNYKNSIPPANENIGINRTTGVNEAWKTNNIYDLAGNHKEMSQEAYHSGSGRRAYFRRMS